jgi:hypothetical protein
MRGTPAVSFLVGVLAVWGRCRAQPITIELAAIRGRYTAVRQRPRGRAGQRARQLRTPVIALVVGADAPDADDV